MTPRPPVLAACFLLVASCALAGGDRIPEAIPSEDRVVVKFTDEARVRLRPGGLVSLGGAGLDEVARVLAAFGHPPVERLFTRVEEVIDRDLRETERQSGRDLADLNGYYEVVVGASRVAALVEALDALEVVQTAYPAPLPVPPPADIPPTTPDFEADQGYLDPAPGGIDAREAWTHGGGRGEGVYVIDIEYDWQDTHEDLGASLGGKVCYQPRGLYIDHGTAVLGEMGGGDNGYGVTGIVNQADFGMVTQYPQNMSNSVARAIDCAASLMDAGDVMLLEAQTGGPHGSYVPVEWNQAEYDAIAAATARGIVVVEAAGNGDEDLDHPDFGGKFDRSVRDSGAIIVGAGASPGSGQPDRSRLSFSTYGSRVDVQGWGHNVTTTGYGGLFNGGGDPNQYYTGTFSGTSSASPVVTGAAAALQGVQMARGGDPLEPTEVRRILAETGTPQQDGPYPGHIGPRPDLDRALDELADLFVSQMVADDDPPLGNGDGILDPGETATLRIAVENASGQTATDITGWLDADPKDLVRVTVPHADWPDLGPAAAAESLPPHHRLTVPPGATCGTWIHFTLDLQSTPFAEEAGFDLEIGQRLGLYAAADTPQSIPKNNRNGITSYLNVADTFTLEDVQATVDILHGDRGQLHLILQSPTGPQVVLHDHTGTGTPDLQTTYDRGTLPDGPGTMDDFNGEAAQGTWSLQVVDDQGGPIPSGSLNAWSLELLATVPFRCEPLTCGDPVPGPMGDSLRLEKSGADDLLLQWSAQTGAAAYRVWRADSPLMDDEAMVGQATGTSLTEAGGQSGPATLVHYQVRAVNSCEWEGP